MTLILGVQCADGVIIAADRKVLRGGEADYEDKIHRVGHASIGFAGLTGLRDDFLFLVDGEIGQARPTTLYELKVVVEDVLFSLEKRYNSRLGPGDEVVDGILGGLERLDSGAATLYHISGGYAERVRFVSIGHGSPYAQGIAKFLFRDSDALNTTEAAKLASFVVCWVTEDLDTTVGGSPQVITYLNGKGTPITLDAATSRKMGAKARTLKRELRTKLGL
ncbi:MAG: hypothetical protein M1126_06870 [Candidatus Thermoplasmatota archaeon]|nr:hypothetical protein [Candidatus Thermoplasmatota archaeon]